MTEEREHFGAVTLEDIGIGVRGMLRRPEETANKYLHIRSTENDAEGDFEGAGGDHWQGVGGRVC